MSGSTTIVDYSSGGRLSTEDMSSGQRCLSDDSLTELRSCGQVENGTPSTSPPYWDTDDDDDDCGIFFLYQFKFVLVHDKFRNNVCWDYTQQRSSLICLSMCKLQSVAGTWHKLLTVHATGLEYTGKLYVKLFRINGAFHRQEFVSTFGFVNLGEASN